ncbi:hypothetical protein ACPOLB_25625 [Rubrivivax sp. RP6-9]|uniref:hypothetical protein n=1 Tax=Rubrivivax sp. RP6-9 TaxID=3415750 RepID=UPI003CC5F65F
MTPKSPSERFAASPLAATEGTAPFGPAIVARRDGLRLPHERDRGLPTTVEQSRPLMVQDSRDFDTGLSMPACTPPQRKP